MLLFILIYGIMDQDIHTGVTKARMVDSFHDDPQTGNCEEYGFDSFLKRFCTDSVFQINRLNKTLVVIEIGMSYDEEDEVCIMDRNNWKYVNFKSLPANYLVNTEKITGSKYKLNIQIEDTGVSVNYTFELIDCKWFLTTIIDEST